MLFFVVVQFLWFAIGNTLDNGLATTPAMGWMSWERYLCNTNCVDYPNDCLSEHLIKRTADAMVKHGFKSAGYKYLAIDDCWMEKTRDAQGNLQPDHKRFPGGMRALADYVHSRGLKLGIYLDIGNLTCAGYPGSAGNFQRDANTIAQWGIDMLKADGCNADVANPAFPDDYLKFSQYLNATGRPILFACCWILFADLSHQPDMDLVDRSCNQYRVFTDVADSWESLKATLKLYGDQEYRFLNYSGPGHWADPDQLVVGDFGLSLDQQKMQMAIWSITSAPLFVSADIASMNPDSRDILQNKLAISINQDQLGMMGRQIHTNGQVRFYRKSILPKGSFALALIYENISGGPSKVTVKLQDLGFNTAAAWNFTDVFDHSFVGTLKPWEYLNAEVNPTGVKFYHALALP